MTMPLRKGHSLVGDVISKDSEMRTKLRKGHAAVLETGPEFYRMGPVT